MSDQSKLGLGKIITDYQEKDAVHVAIAPVMAGQTLIPGQHVGFRSDGTVGDSDKPIGVVDPFLKEQYVRKGQKFWLFLYPGSITSLRHDWTHPEFGKEPKLVTNSKKWVETFAEDLGMFYDEVMADAKNHRTKSGPLDGLLKADTIWDQFWNHYHIIIEGESK